MEYKFLFIYFIEVFIIYESMKLHSISKVTLFVAIFDVLHKIQNLLLIFLHYHNLHSRNLYYLKIHFFVQLIPFK